jgi:4-amino-4-deoxy-L-arabinose transferase-like glycosyltransferase
MVTEQQPEARTNSSRSTPASWRPALALILLLAAASYLFRLGAMDFVDTLEVRRVMIARNTLERGEWLIPHLKNTPQLTKPPLVYWAMALVGKIGGAVNETTARIPSVLAGLAGIFLVFLIGKMLFNPTTGLLAAMMLATSSLYYSESRFAELDSPLVAFSLLAIWAYWKANAAHRSKHRLVYFLLFFAAMGLAFMSKGPLGIIVPLGPVVITLLLARDFKRLKTIPWFFGIVALLCVIVPWVAVAKLRGFPIFETFREEMSARFSETFRHQKPFKYYTGKFDSLAFPWSFLLVPMIGFGISAVIRNRTNIPSFMKRIWADLTAHNARLLYLLAWFLGITLLLSVMPVKRDYYFLPVVPAWALLAASFAASMAKKINQPLHAASRWLAVSAALLVGILFFYLAATRAINPRDFSGNHFPDLHLLLIILGATSLCIAAVSLVKRSNTITLCACLAMGVLVGQFYFTARYTPLLNAQDSPKKFCQYLLNTYPSAQFIAYQEDNFAIQYYLNKDVPKTDDLAQIREFLAGGRNRLAITTSKVWQRELEQQDFAPLAQADYYADGDKAPLLFALKLTSQK